MTLACVGQAAAGAVVRGSVQARSRRPWRGARHACGGAVRRARRARGAGRPRAVQQRVLQPHVQVAEAHARAKVEAHQQLPEQGPRALLAQALPARAAGAAQSDALKREAVLRGHGCAPRRAPRWRPSLRLQHSRALTAWA